MKQKQANLSEARSARQSAEEAALQAEETTRQGYSIMLVSPIQMQDLAQTCKLTLQTVYYCHHPLRKSLAAISKSLLTRELVASILAGQSFCS